MENRLSIAQFPRMFGLLSILARILIYMELIKSIIIFKIY